MKLTNIDDIRRHIEQFIWPNEEAKQRDKRERILLAATKLFVGQGYRKTSMDEVARMAGVAKGTLYLYYRNKAELVYHAIALEKRNHVDRLAPVVEATLSPRQRLGTWVAVAIIIVREMPLTSSLIQGDHEIALALNDMDATVLEDTNAAQIDALMELLGDAADSNLAASDLALRCQVLLDLMSSVTTFTHLHASGASSPDYVATLAEAIVNGALSVDVSVDRELLNEIASNNQESSNDRLVASR